MKCRHFGLLPPNEKLLANMLTQYSHFLIIITLCIYPSYSKYAKDPKDEAGNFGVKGAVPSQDSYEEALVDEDEKELPAGYVVLDGVVLDTTNLVIQEATDNSTKYKMYKTQTGMANAVLYERSSREAGWHFILFEDPQETSGTGHLILLQKLLGFTMDTGMVSNRERRLYEIFHVDLSNKITDDFGEEGDNEIYVEIQDDQHTSIREPNDSAEIVSSQNVQTTDDDEV